MTIQIGKKFLIIVFSKNLVRPANTLLVIIGGWQQAIKKANDIEHMAYLWQLYSDFSQLLEKKNQNEGKKKAVNESKKILQTIIGHFQNNDLKQTFIKSKQVSGVINK